MSNHNWNSAFHSTICPVEVAALYCVCVRLCEGSPFVLSYKEVDGRVLVCLNVIGTTTSL